MAFWKKEKKGGSLLGGNSGQNKKYGSYGASSIDTAPLLPTSDAPGNKNKYQHRSYGKILGVAHHSSSGFNGLLQDYLKHHCAEILKYGYSDVAICIEGFDKSDLEMLKKELITQPHQMRQFVMHINDPTVADAKQSEKADEGIAGLAKAYVINEIEKNPRQLKHIYLGNEKQLANLSKVDIDAQPEGPKSPPSTCLVM